jgi:hypothetical protein
MVNLFVVKKIARVKQAGLVDHLSPDKVVAPWNPVAIALYGRVPAWIIDELGLRKEPA